MRHIVLGRYKLDPEAEDNTATTGNVNLDADVINRSSIITMFERKESPEANFSMLFTGDAYDQKCDIRDTLISWRPALSPTIKIDVLKVSPVENKRGPRPKEQPSSNLFPDSSPWIR